MNELYEALKGFTDLPLAVLAFLFAVLCKKHATPKGWATLYAIIGVAATLGAFVHGVALPPLVGALVWVVLYPLLFEAVRRFGVVFAAAVDHTYKPSPRGVFIAELLFYLAALAALFLLLPYQILNYDILLFAIFAVLIFIQTAIRIFRAPKLSKLTVLFLALLAIPLLLQIFESVIPYAVVIEHTFLAVELYIAYRIARTAADET